ncbi:UNVERIFIED_CONTAM: Magnesium transporter MRS2-3 [Sesamum calycinum]|uniref:Magnesium transporter MRS2-3 n=1 Tax=Sesamum calycinum TaxID=2727403 RepID=A0AAW2N3U8_9LAMI
MRGAPPQPPKQAAGPPQAEDDGTAEPLLRPAAGGVSIGGGLRKKAAGVRPWLLLDSTGQAQVVEAGKHAIMRRTGLPARDLRILDPLLSYPSTVLGRERAIVINLEHIKAIITAQEVLLLNSRDPSVIPFVDELQRRILRHNQAIKSQEAGDGESADWTNLYDLEEPRSTPASPPNYSEKFPSKEEVGKAEGKEQSGENRDGPKLLPFEFVALEACLEAACSCLENEARTLEQEAHPALDKLTSKISTLNLERVRQIKSRLVAITGRVQKVRDELEHLLDDDDDMAEMYLTDKQQAQLENSSLSSMNEDVLDEDDVQANADDRTPAEILMEGNDSSELQQIDSHREQLFGGANALSRGSHGTHTSTHSAISKHLDVEELEMLLEAYFVQIDGTLNKLSTLREYVDDTEDYINIMLDDKQNHLLQMGVMLTTATLVVSAFVVVARDLWYEHQNRNFQRSSTWDDEVYVDRWGRFSRHSFPVCDCNCLVQTQTVAGMSDEPDVPPVCTKFFPCVKLHRRRGGPMGNSGSSSTDPRFASAARAFTQKELEDLRSLHASLAVQSQSNGKYVSPDVFKAYIGIDGPLGDRVFDLVTQKRKDQKLTFEDLVIAKGTYEKGTNEDIEEFIYQLLDVSGDGTNDLEVVLTSVLDNLFHCQSSETKAGSNHEIVMVFINAANFTSDSMSLEDFRKWCTLLPAVRKYLGSLLMPSDSGGANAKSSVFPCQFLGCCFYLLVAMGWVTVELNCRNDGPTVLIIKDTDGYIYGGYASQPWERHSDFYGDMRSFLFQLYPVASIFRPTGANHNLQWCAVNFSSESIPNGIGFGGRVNHFGLFLSANFDQGHTFSCITFGSPCLSKTPDLPRGNRMLGSGSKKS